MLLLLVIVYETTLFSKHNSYMMLMSQPNVLLLVY